MRSSASVAQDNQMTALYCTTIHKYAPPYKSKICGIANRKDPND